MGKIKDNKVKKAYASYYDCEFLLSNKIKWEIHRDAARFEKMILQKQAAERILVKPLAKETDVKSLVNDLFGSGFYIFTRFLVMTDVKYLVNEVFGLSLVFYIFPLHNFIPILVKVPILSMPIIPSC